MLSIDSNTLEQPNHQIATDDLFISLVALLSIRLIVWQVSLDSRTEIEIPLYMLGTKLSVHIDFII